MKKKIEPYQVEIDTLRIPKEFDFDNLYIMHDSDYQFISSDPYETIRMERSKYGK